MGRANLWSMSQAWEITFEIKEEYDYSLLSEPFIAKNFDIGNSEMRRSKGDIACRE